MKDKLGRQKKNNHIAFGSLVFSLTLGMFGLSYAAGITLGSAAANVTQSMNNVAKLITSAAYVGGFGFAVSAILKFKAHKDMPQQVGIGTPIAFLFIAAALIFLPTIFGMENQTIFGGNGSVAGVSGTTSF
jgi:intracellular multiplication protein IcmD